MFGEDPINDLIAEEAGRILGVKLRFGTLTKTNLVATLDDAFNEARAWVGSLLRVRRGELERWILEKTQRRANMWWGARPSPSRRISTSGVLPIRSRIESTLAGASLFT